MNSYPENGAVGKHLLMLRQRSRRRRMLRKLLLPVFVVMLMALVLLMSGCAAHSPKPCEPLPPILKPVPDKSAPSVSFLQQVQTFLEESRKKLIAGQSKP